MAETSSSPSPSDSSRIVSIAAGEAHTLALAGDGRVYSWGRGFFGRLGTGSESDQYYPVPINFDVDNINNLNIVDIAAGAYHSLALADNGSVWGWGYNIYGQVAVHEDNYMEPHLLEGFIGLASPNSSTTEHETKNGEPLKISSVKAGGMMSLAIDNLGALWMWGNCPNPSQNESSEGEFSLSSSTVPMPVLNFHGHTVVKVACGNEHVIALVTGGEEYEGGDLLCYSWGDNKHGQLGLGDNESRLHPEIIKTSESESLCGIYEIACGASHTALLAKEKKPSDTPKTFCWTFGFGDNGQLGHGTTQSLNTPKLVRELPESALLVSVDCGLFHTSVVSSAGEVWSWGMEKGLGLCPDARFTGSDAGDAISPLLYPRNGIHDPKFREPVQIACGAAHTVLLADAGYKIWSWGRGSSGVLGNGTVVDNYAPTLVLWPSLSSSLRQDKLQNAGENDDSGEKDVGEMQTRLSAAMDEMKLLQAKLDVMERYASILHGSIFGNPLQEHDIPATLRSSGTLDLGKEWDNMLESLDRRKLVRLEMFYNDMLAGVKDKLMRKTIKEVLEECLNSASTKTTV